MLPIFFLDDRKQSYDSGGYSCRKCELRSFFLLFSATTEASFTWKVREMQQMKNTILRNINRDIIIRTQSDKCRVPRFSKSLKSLCSRELTTWKILPGGQTLLEFRLSQLKIDQGRHCQTGRSCSAVLAEYFGNCHLKWSINLCLQNFSQQCHKNRNLFIRHK